MTSSEKKIVEITFLLLKKKKWKNLSLIEIKKKSKVKSFNKLIKNKNVILKMINCYIDYKLSLEIKNIEQSNNKDMIFEVLMMRFDILQQYRGAVISIYNSFKSKPQDLIYLLPSILDSIVLMINFTNISSKGIKGQLKIKGVLVIYLHSFLVWINDDSASLEKTMTALDKNLDNAGKIISFIK